MEEQASIPYFAHEGMMARAERTNHRLWVLCIVLIISLIATNLAWILYESQLEVYEETTVTQSADAESGDAINRYAGGNYVEGDTDGDN